MSQDFCTREMRRLVADIPATEAEDLWALEEEVTGIMRRAGETTEEEMRSISTRMRASFK